MVLRDDITQFIYQTLGAEFLEKAVTIDSYANSVQIKGKEKVQKIAFGVSCSLEFLEQAVAQKAQYCVFHHGLSDQYVHNGRFNPIEERLRLIFKKDLTVAGFHFALDAHKKLGNNAQIIKHLGAIRKEPYFDKWGWVAEFAEPIEAKKLADACSELFEHDIFAVYAGPKKVKRIGVCSGGAKPRAHQMLEIVDKNIDLHLTGEISESSPYFAEELGFNYFACGHYATETFGVKALAEAVKQNFGDQLEVEFIDVPSVL